MRHSVYIGLTTLLWGGLAILPTDSFGISPAFIIMKQMATEETWGIIAIALGSGLLTALWRKTWKGEVLFTLGVLFFWCIVEIAFAFAQPFAFGTIMYGMIAIYCADHATELWAHYHNRRIQ